MKRTAQMKDAGILSAGMRAYRFHGFRGVGKPKREWQPGPLMVERPKLVERMAKAAAEGKATPEEFHAKAVVLPVPKKPMWAKITSLFTRRRST